MPRPKNKAELLSASHELFEELLKVCDTWQEEVHADFLTPTMNKNPRDVLAHIHVWHLMYVEWHSVGMNGGKADMPAKGYTWSQCPELNRNIWGDCQNLSYDEVISLIKESHQLVIQLAEAMTEEELFERKRYKWTGSTFVAQYMISALSSHYDWGIKMIKKAQRALKSA